MTCEPWVCEDDGTLITVYKDGEIIAEALNRGRAEHLSEDDNENEEM
jgi:hypothetical protein